jgi:hypothetical protein
MHPHRNKATYWDPPDKPLRANPVFAPEEAWFVFNTMDWACECSNKMFQPSPGRGMIPTQLVTSPEGSQCGTSPDCMEF